MNWWQNNPWYGPPPYGQPPPNYIPTPPGVDPLTIARYFEMVRRREERERKKAEAEKKDKDKKKEEPKITMKDVLWYFQAATVLWFLSPFIGAIQHAIELALK